MAGRSRLLRVTPRLRFATLGVNGCVRFATLGVNGCVRFATLGGNGCVRFATLGVNGVARVAALAWALGASLASFAQDGGNPPQDSRASSVQAQNAGASAPASPPLVETKLDIRRFKLIERDSGNINYYEKVLDDPEGPMLRARYRPGVDTAVLGLEIPEALRSKVKRVHWRWRVIIFPVHGNECAPGKGDSAASVFVTFKRGLKYYILKYSWSTDGPKGAVCDKRRNPFLVRDTVILESDGPTNSWIDEAINPRTEFVRHFGGSEADVPDLVGLGVMTDGDQTNSPAQADYADFSVSS